MKRSILLALSFIAATSASASYDLNQVLTQLENREKSISAIQFNFEQDIFFTQMNTSSTVGGEALFAKAGKLHITKSHPDKQETVSDGRKVWVFNPEFNQVWEGSTKKWMESSVLPKGIIPLENYVTELKKNFSLKMVRTDDNGQIQISAIPKDKMFAYRLELTVSTDSWLPTETVYVSESARVVTRWSDHKINPDVAENAFRFVVPKGTDVIPLN